jgi:hypothetical protein
MNIDQEPNATDAGKPPAYWPASGALKVENLCARYSSDGPEVKIFIMGIWHLPHHSIGVTQHFI